MSKKQINRALNVVTQIGTFGLAGTDDQGRLKQGTITHWAGEAIGEVTGRNQARGMANAASDRIAAEDAQRKLDEQNQQLQNYRMDLLASRTAQGLRDTAAARSKNNAVVPTTDGASAKLGGGDESLLGV